MKVPFPFQGVLCEFDMKILSICLSCLDEKGKVKILASSYDLSSIAYFKRNTVQETCNFLVCTFAERVPRNSRHSLEEKGK